MAKKQRKIGTGMQSLEQKAMMAGDVAASVSNGDLWISEASYDVGEDQHINVYQLSNGKIRVQGIYSGADSTRVNGQSYQDFNVTDDIYIRMGDGDDWVNIKNNNGGVDADYVSIHMDGTSNPYSYDNDILSVNGISTTNSMYVRTGGGSDQVSITNSNIGNGSNEDLTIYTGDWADDVDLTNVTVRDQLFVDLGTADDDLKAFNTSARDITFKGQAGGDDFDLDYVSASSDLVLDLGSGNDDVNARYTNADFVNINAGQGHDEVFMQYGTIDYDLRFDGGTGNDDLEVRNMGIKRKVELQGGENSGDFDELVFKNNYYFTNWDVTEWERVYK